MFLPYIEFSDTENETMAQAKTIKPEQFQQVVAMLNNFSERREIDNTLISLSFKGGLRACELAGLSWREVTDVFGKVRSDAFAVTPAISKYGKARVVPMHPETHAALVALHASLPKERTRSNMPVIPARDGTFWKANSLQKYMGRLYRKMGLDGVSSHSGRRSCLTAMAQRANTYGCSLRDVQLVAGHSSIKTTEAYIEASDGLSDLMRSL